MSARKLTRQDLREAAERFKNWGRWGPDDEIGTLNYTRPEDIVAAARIKERLEALAFEVTAEPLRETQQYVKSELAKWRRWFAIPERRSTDSTP